jgi:transaldolase
MEVPAFARLLKQLNIDSEVWWDSSPTQCASLKLRLLSLYPDSQDCIEKLLSDPFSRRAGNFSGATTNPILITRTVLDNSPRWQQYLDSLPIGLSATEKARRVYDQAVVDAAHPLYSLWISSARQQGWLSAQIDGAERMSESTLVARGMQLASLAPNVMVKVPGSEQGYRAIEQLVSQGCSINNTFCFTVSQVAACLKAIHNGRLRAQVQGVSTADARYVISFMIGRLGAEPEFELQARQRRQHLSSVDRRWAELAVYQAIQALLRRWETPARLLLCSLKIDTDVRGREYCWHLQRTGAETTLYTLTPQIVEFLFRRQRLNQPIEPANDWVQVPRRVLDRLVAIPYFNQAYFEGELSPADFSRHPAFLTASHDAREGQERLLAYVKGLSGEAVAPAGWPLLETRMERAS